MAALLTPNIPEAEVLAEMEIFTEEDMIAAARKISEAYGCAVLCKGGHQKNDANDLLYQMEHFDGSVEEGLRIRIPMELDVRFPVRLLPTLQKDFRWKKV